MCAVCLVLLSFMHSIAQPASLLLDHYTTAEGLGNNIVWSLTKTRYGYTWLGTQDGLCRFDGRNFKIFRHSPTDSNSITNNTVYELMEDTDGYLWAGTFDGLNRFNQAFNRFEKISRGAYQDKTVTRMGIGAIAEDKKNHVIWIGARGLYYVNQQTLALEAPRGRMNKDVFEGSGDITSLLVESAGRIWIGSDKGLILYNSITGAYFVYHSPQEKMLAGDYEHFISKMFLDRHGKLWLATLGAGLLEFDTAQRKYMGQYLLETNDGFRGGTNRIFDIALTDFPDQQDILWLVADNPGFSAFNTVTRKFISYSTGNADSRSGVYKNAFCLFFDKEDGLWIGGIKGLYRYDRRLQVYTTHKFNYNFPNGCISEVFDAYPDPADSSGNTLWIGTWGCGLYKYNLATKKFDEVPAWIKKAIRPPTISTYFSILRDRQGLLWVGSSDDGLLKIDEKKKQVQYLYPGDAVHTVTKLFADDEGWLWVGTPSGLFVLDKEKETFSEIKFDITEVAGKPISRSISGICQDRNGNIWFAAEGQYKETHPAAGLVKKGSTIAAMYYPAAGDGSSFPDAGTISNLVCDNNNQIWCASWNGLIHWDAGQAKPVFAVLTTDDGLLNNFIFTVQKDNTGNIWCGSINGISVWLSQKKKIRNYSNTGIDRDNIEYLFYNPQQLCLIVGDLGSIHTLKPDVAGEIINPPPVVITDFLVFDKPAAEVKKKVFDKSKITLAYNRNVVTIDFAALTFYNPSQVRYAYKMEGIDNDWLFTSNNSVTYNLNNGHYIFRVKAMNAEGLWNEEGTYMEITVKSPFWKQPWFIGMMILAVTALLYRLYRYRINQLKKMHTIRNNISQNLHDDIGSSLSNINILNELAKRNAANPEKSKEYLDKSGEDIQRISESLSDIVWNISPRYDDLKNLFIRMKRYAADMMDGKNISYQFDFPEEAEHISLPMEKRRDMYLVFKEAVNNLVKYSKASEASVKVITGKKKILVEVKDNGKGFDTGNVNAGNGLLNMRQRAAACGADLDIISRPGMGTTVKLEMNTT